MLELHVSRPSLLEVGEESHLTLRVADSQGKTSNIELAKCSVSSNNTNIVGVNGLCLTGLAPGTARISVRSTQEATPRECGWDVEVIGQRPYLNVPFSSHPRILFSESELTEFRKRVSHQSSSVINDYGGFNNSSIRFPELWKAFLDTADHFVREQRVQVKYPSVSHVMEVELPIKEPETIPNPSGYVDYPFWTMFSRAVEERLTVLSTAYLVTSEPAYAEKVKMYLLGLAGFSKWYEFDHNGAKGNLSNAHLVIGVSTGFDAICDTLTQPERKQVADALLYRGLQPLAVDIGNTDMHNIIAAKQVAMMFGASALHGESPYASKYMKQAFDYLVSFLDRKLLSHETEGFLYDNVAARHIWMAADLYRRVTGDSVLCNHSYLKEELPERFFRFLSPGGVNTFPNFSDSYLELGLAYMMSMVASHHAHPVAMWYVQRFESEKPPVLLNLRHTPTTASPDEYYGEQASRAFQTIGWASLRTGWGEHDHLLCFTSGGSSRGHNHKDQNNLMLNVAGEWLLSNPGYQDYVPGPKADYTVGTVGHNSLLINDKGQRVRGGGALTEVWLTPRFEVVQGNATASYDGLLTSYRRSILHVNRDYYLVWDEVETNDAADVPELLFHTMPSIALCEQDIVLKPGATLKGNVASVNGDKAALQIMVAFPQDPQIRVLEYPGAEVYGPYLSVQGRASDSTAKQFVTLLRPSTAGAPLRVADCTEDAAGGVGLTIQYDEWNRAVMMLCSGEPRDTIYAGYRLKGRALCVNEEKASNAETKVELLAAWDTELLEADGLLSLHAEAPVSFTIDLESREIVLNNAQNRQVDVTLSAPGQYQRKWTLSHGEHTFLLEGHNEGVNV